MGLLHDAGLAAVYEQDVFGLNPLLDAMSERGMPVNPQFRLRVAQDLATERQDTLDKIRALIPPECCPTKVYKRRPTDETARREAVAVTVTRCLACGQLRVTKTHRCTKQGALVERVMTPGERWVVPQSFVPSPKGLLAYLRHRGYPAPTRFGRFTTDEAALRRLALKHEHDLVFPLVLKYRECDKLLSTYVGRPTP